jgi:peptide/nickel transport system ATP-binding protein
MTEKPLLEINNLSIVYPHARKSAEVVKNISFSVHPGQFVSIVGESGSGKSTLASSIIGLLPSGGYISSGSIHFQGKDIAGAGTALRGELAATLRGKLVGYIPQDALSGLDPLVRVGRQVEEAVLAHGKIGKKAAREKRLQSMKDSGLPEPELLSQCYPHELSGGMKQRVLIAAGFVNKPKILIADEPTSALDVIVQQKILASIQTLIHESNTALLFITHSIALASHYSDYVIVMKDGTIVEQGPSGSIWKEPQNEYTKKLVAAAPCGISAIENKTNNDNTGFCEHKKNSIAAGVMLEVEDITKYYRGKKSPAVKNASFTLYEGETLSIIGSSGSGKTTLASILLQLEQPDTGIVRFYGEDIKTFSKEKRKLYHRNIQAIFQNPYESLNPLFSIYNILEEPLRAFNRGGKNERNKRINQILDEVALPKGILERRPRDLSGGQCQRVAIARALITEPRLVICDEAVSALDVLVQSQILELLKALRKELNMAYIFITHDLSVAASMADTVFVMKNGEIVEGGKKEEIFTNPKNDYTRALLDASLFGFAPELLTVNTENNKRNNDEIGA